MSRKILLTGNLGQILSKFSKSSSFFQKPIYILTYILALTRTRINFLAYFLLWSQKPLKEDEPQPCPTERERQKKKIIIKKKNKKNNTLQD